CEVTAIQLPGRGSRMQEPPATSIPQLVEELMPVVLARRDLPFAFFGHSMGASISFELARRLRREGAPGPLHLFVSGRSAPQLDRNYPSLHALPRAELLEELKRLNGTPREVLEHAELMELLLPILRADFSICDTYKHAEEPPLNCPITVFGGLEDSFIPRPRLEAWRVQTAAAFTLRMLPGDHFFLHSQKSLLLRLLAAELQRLAAGLHG
ncbi:MAG: thioesterase, partial [Acidobacteria bacterium]|nr:thioesterase [Acidobacteriota bacterium]